ncbi:FkbM family methyltransferase [Nocardiopsis salina]|uniref:FkbM family methyltransferase n=1 Tax=Nocardiopsis salina TaxID=245836 RepID=UPI0003451940|nr:FkbM family methyltransferase [Nocardiopsis salina]
MVTDQLRALVRRYPLVRFATQRLRTRLPRRFGGLDASRLPPWSRRLTVDLPRPEGWPEAGPDRLELELPGYLTVPRRLAGFGLAQHERASLARFLAAVEHAEPGAVLDVGSGVGVYAALAAARSRRAVFAFEPTPELASAARTVSGSGDLGFTVVGTAVGNYNGTARLRRSSHNDMCNATVSGATRTDLAHTQVPLVSLSRWNEEAATRPRVVTVDTAGSEPDVIAGALEVLRRHRPWVLVKVRPDRGLEERLMALLEPLEYWWYPVRDEVPPSPRMMISARESPSWERMWLLAPHEPRPEYWGSVLAWRSALAGCLPVPGPGSQN